MPASFTYSVPVVESVSNHSTILVMVPGGRDYFI